MDEDAVADCLCLEGSSRPRVAGGVVEQGCQDGRHHVGGDGHLEIAWGVDLHLAALGNLSQDRSQPAARLSAQARPGGIEDRTHRGAEPVRLGEDELRVDLCSRELGQLGLATQYGHRCPQLVGDLVGQPPLVGDGVRDPAEEPIEGLGQLAELVTSRPQAVAADRVVISPHTSAIADI